MRWTRKPSSVVPAAASCRAIAPAARLTAVARRDRVARLPRRSCAGAPAPTAFSATGRPALRRPGPRPALRERPARHASACPSSAAGARRPRAPASLPRAPGPRRRASRPCAVSASAGSEGGSGRAVRRRGVPDRMGQRPHRLLGVVKRGTAPASAAAAASAPSHDGEHRPVGSVRRGARCHGRRPPARAASGRTKTVTTASTASSSSGRAATARTDPRSPPRSCPPGSRSTPRPADHSASCLRVAPQSGCTRSPAAWQASSQAIPGPPGVGEHRDTIAGAAAAGARAAPRRRTSRPTVSARNTPAWRTARPRPRPTPPAARRCATTRRAPAGRPSALDRHDRLGRGDPPRDPRETARIPERLQVEQQTAVSGVLLPVLEEVAAGQVGLVAHRDERREPDARAPPPRRSPRSRRRRSAKRRRRRRAAARRARPSRRARSRAA